MSKRAEKVAAAYVAAKEQVATTLATWTEVRRSQLGELNGEARIPLLDSEAAYLRACNAFDDAAKAFDAELHRGALASGDRDAHLSDLGTLAHDLEEGIEEARRLRAVWAEQIKSNERRVIAAFEARDRVAQLRVAEALPAPAAIPRTHTDSGWLLEPNGFLAHLTKARSAPPAVDIGRADKLSKIEHDLLNIRATVETERLRREEEREQQAARVADHAREQEERHARVRAENQRDLEEGRKPALERNRLAAAHAARG